MTRCVFCEGYNAMDDIPKELGNPRPDWAAHKACSDEWRRRFNSDRCLTCGDTFKVNGEFDSCRKCDHYSPYQGYPGGST